MLTIRPSSLPMVPDCARRQAARSMPAEIADAGYTLEKLAPSVGAGVGSATHSAVAFAMTEKLTSGTLPPNDTAEQAGIAELHKRIQNDGVQWDATTPKLSVAERQVQRQYRAYRMDLAERIIPIAVERRINVPTKRGNMLSGQIDLTDTGIRDVKTGTVARNNIAQYGGYSLLRRAEGGTVAHIIEDYIQRVPVDDAQPAPVAIAYKVELAELVSARLIQAVEDNYEKFMQTGDNMTFLANPASVLCGPKFCPAWGTDFCQEGRGL